MSLEGKPLRRWQLCIDCVLFVGVTAICTLVIGGLGDCGTAPDAAQIADCKAFTVRKVLACAVIACLVFPALVATKATP